MLKFVENCGPRHPPKRVPWATIEHLTTWTFFDIWLKAPAKLAQGTHQRGCLGPQLNIWQLEHFSTSGPRHPPKRVPRATIKHLTTWIFLTSGPRHPPKWPKAPAKEGALDQMSKNIQAYFIHINFFCKPIKKNLQWSQSYTAMLLYLFFDSLLSTCPKKMETKKWPKAADSPLFKR